MTQQRLMGEAKLCASAIPIANQKARLRIEKRLN
jgi:hypothetical protein